MRVVCVGLRGDQAALLQQALVDIPLRQVDSRELMTALREQPCRVLILGPQLGAQGIPVLEGVRQVFGAHSLPVLYVVASQVDADKAKEQASRLQASDTLVEPFAPIELVRHAADLLGIPWEMVPTTPTGSLGRSRTRNVAPRDWRAEQAVIAPRLEVLEKAAKAKEEGTLSRLLTRSGVFEAEKLRQFLSERGHETGVRLISELVLLLEGTEQGSALRLMEVLRAALVEPPGAREPVASVAPEPPPEPVAPDQPQERGRGCVLIVDPDEAFAASLWLEAQGRGLQVVSLPDVSHAAAFAQQQRPDVIIVDPVVAPTWDEMATFFGQIQSITPPIAILMVTDNSDQSARLAADGLGADLFVAKPHPAADILSLAEELMGLSRRARWKVLVVDDDPVALATVQAMFDTHGIDCVQIEEPTQFWEALERSQPDLLVLDLGLPGVDGTQLCRIVRNDPHWRSIPIVFLTAIADPEALEAGYRAGADDFATKPIAPEHFVSRVLNRLERQRAALSSARMDALTGLESRSWATERLATMLRLAAVEQVSVALAVLNLDLFQDINVVLGFETGDAILHHLAELLQKSLPSLTLLARWSGDEFVAAFYGQGREWVENTLTELLGHMRAESFGLLDGQPLHVTWSCGVSQYPRDGTNLLDLYRSASAAVAEVKRRSRNGVLSSAWFETSDFAELPLDLVLVLDDEMLASRILTALGVRGYHGHWIGVAHSLLTRLVAAATLRPGLVVLWNVDLPWLDGWELLRLTRQDPILSSAKLVLMADQPTEETQERARMLGVDGVLATDVPFTMLLHYLRQALGS
ncbi:MAG TPA: response regulator [Candidatus Xenobia bacterium]|jgi:diguanylate cyclase (GGDEF)-like protein